MLWDLILKVFGWRLRNYRRPKLTEWEQTRAAARRDAAVEALRNGDLLAAFRYIRNG